MFLRLLQNILITQSHIKLNVNSNSQQKCIKKLPEMSQHNNNKVYDQI